MNFPDLVASNATVAEYCNYIEYQCFTLDEMPFYEFDINEGSFSLEDVIDELNRRLILYGSYKPFVVFKQKVKSLFKIKNRHLSYYYCLYYSVVGGKSSSTITNIFEKITDISLKNYFGKDAVSIVTAVGQNTKNLPTTIHSIYTALNESMGNIENMPKRAKDGGVDIITYKPLDTRGNQLICLTDATIGKHWKDEKVVLNQLVRWREYIHFKLEPSTCLSIVHIVSPEDFHAASKSNGMLFDRARIMKFFSTTTEIDSDLNQWFAKL